MSEPKTVGIIGGLGPAATADFFTKLIQASPATRDQDHLRVLIDNNPRIPDRNAAIAGEGPSPGPTLAAAAAGLQRAGADFIVMPCNTAHAFQAEIEAAITAPFVSMIDASVDATINLGAHRVGVLVANGCRRAGLYQNAFAARGVEAVLLSEDEQRAFMTLIYGVKAGEVGAAARARMRAFAQRLIDQSVDVVLAGCTEIPLLLLPSDIGAPLVDSTAVLVARTNAFAINGD